MSIDSAASLVLDNEGERLAAYDDATGEPVPVGGAVQGTLTIGVGHTGSDVHPGAVWSQAQSRMVFAADLAAAAQGAARVLGTESWSLLNPPIQAVLTDMAFQLGAEGLSEWPVMLAAIRTGNWPMAEYQLRASRLANEAPRRVSRNASMLMSGTWPVDD